MIPHIRTTKLFTCVFVLASVPAVVNAQPDSEPLKRSDLPLPVIVDGQSGDVNVSLDGETVQVTGTVSATLDEPVEVSGTVAATLDEPVEVSGTVAATLDEPVAVTGTVFADTGDPSIPASEWRNRFITTGSVTNGGIGSYTFNLPDYVFSLRLNIGATKATCEVVVIAYDGANGEPNVNTNPFMTLAGYVARGRVEDSWLVETAQNFNYPGGVYFGEWTEPRMRVVVDPQSDARCYARLFLTAANIPAG